MRYIAGTELLQIWILCTPFLGLSNLSLYWSSILLHQILVWSDLCTQICTKNSTFFSEVIYKVVDKWLKTFFHYSNGKEGESYRKKSTIIINDCDDKFWPSTSRDCLMRNGAHRKNEASLSFTYTINKDQTISALLKISFCITVKKKDIFANGCKLQIYTRYPFLSKVQC